MHDYRVWFQTQEEKQLGSFDSFLNNLIQCRIWGSRIGGYEEFYFLGYNAM
jgi:hypothetical protein